MSSLYSGMNYNEQFTTTTTNVNGSNWVRGSETPGTNSQVIDNIPRYGVNNTPAPIPTLVCSCNATEAQYTNQQWYVGSRTTGSGVSLQTDALIRDADMGAHNSIVAAN